VLHDGGEILVLAHGGAVFAFENLCIHRERPLAKGVVLNGRIVCPGHQWAFDLATGWEAVKGECPPMPCGSTTAVSSSTSPAAPRRGRPGA
jgi:nitrite reductase/ring-hydroxylating ferredoxin subunit